MVESIQDQRIWDCYLSHKDIIKDKTILSTSVHILYTWTKIHFKPEIENIEDILMSQICGNSLIKRRNRPIMDRIFLDMPFTRIIEIVDLQNSRFYTYDKLGTHYHHSLQHLEYYSIISAIPKMWKYIIRQEASQLCGDIDCEPLIEKLAPKIGSTVSISKGIYWPLLESHFPTTIVNHVIWNMELGTHLTQEEYLDLFPIFLKQIKAC